MQIKDSGKILITYLYVDDLIYTRNHAEIFEKFKKSMIPKFGKFDLSLLH